MATTPSPIESGNRSSGAWPDFPEEFFTVRDDPASAQQAAGDYMPFSREAAATVQALTELSVESWVGVEGDLFRSRRAEFEPMMRTAAQVFRQAFRAITEFIHDLTELKSSMNRLRVHAEGVWIRLQAAKEAAAAAAVAVGDAYTAFQSEAGIPGAPGVATAEAAYRSAEASRQYADSQLAAIQAEWDSCVSEARRIHQDLHDAAERAASVIDGLEEPPPAPAPSAGGYAAGPTDILTAPATIQGRRLLDEVNGALDAIDRAYTQGGEFIDSHCHDLRSWLGVASPLLEEGGQALEVVGLGIMALARMFHRVAASA